MFFVRSLLGLGVVFALLPVAPEDKDKIEYISPIEAIGAAANAVRDMSGFCGRNPLTCETGGKAAVALGYKAKFGAQKLLETVNAKENAQDGTPQTANNAAIAPQVEAVSVQIKSGDDVEQTAEPQYLIAQPALAIDNAPKPRARPLI